MTTISFELLPQAVLDLSQKIDNIEKLLLNRSNETVPEEDIFLTIQEAADFLNVSVPTVYGYVHRNEIPVNKGRKRLYFSKQELTDWIKAGRRKTNAETANEAQQYFQRKK